MKDSGIEWIGEIPDDWSVKRLKYMAEAGATGLNVSDAKKHGKYKVYDANKIIGYTDNFYIPEKYISIIKDGAGVGRTRILPAKSNVINTMNYITTEDELNLKFLFYILNIFDFNIYIKSTTIPHIYFSSYSNEFMPLPLLSEQKAIADYLDKKTSSIDKIKDKK